MAQLLKIDAMPCSLDTAISNFGTFCILIVIGFFLMKFQMFWRPSYWNYWLMASYKTDSCSINFGKHVKLCLFRGFVRTLEKLCKDLSSIFHHCIILEHVVFAPLLVRIFSSWVSEGFEEGVRNVNTSSLLLYYIIMLFYHIIIMQVWLNVATLLLKCEHINPVPISASYNKNIE